MSIHLTILLRKYIKMRSVARFKIFYFIQFMDSRAGAGRLIRHGGLLLSLDRAEA